MRLAKTASTFLSTVCRKQPGRIRYELAGGENDGTVKSWTDETTIAALRKSRRVAERVGLTSLGKRRRSMGQTAVHIHEDDGTQSRQAHKRRAMDAECHIQLVSEDESSAETTSEGSDDGDEIDESVAEDMRKLEESFKGISQKYRLIN